MPQAEIADTEAVQILREIEADVNEQNNGRTKQEDRKKITRKEQKTWIREIKKMTGMGNNQVRMAESIMYTGGRMKGNVERI